jgi:type I restriction enzyme M protein
MSARRLDPEHTAPDVQKLRGLLDKVGAVSLHSLATSIAQGVQASQYSDEGAVRIVKTKDVRFPSLNLAACELAHDDGWETPLERGDLLINTTGEGTLGRAGVMPDIDDAPTFAAVDISILKIDPTKALPEYVALVLNSWIGKRQSLALQTGSSGQQHFYPLHFRSLRVPIPLLDSGEVDLAWQVTVAGVADRRREAMVDAAAAMAEIDEVFAASLGVRADLSTIPA